MDSVVHFEITVDNIDRAGKFYSKNFGWNLQSYPEMKYVIVRTTEVDDKMMPKSPGSINGGMMERNDSIKNPVITINVKNIHKSLEDIKKSGGKVVLDPMEVGDMGLAAYFQDTEGNVLGLWQSLK